ncbi:hypothetical protein H2198_009648 [Neophaeococcomyces mojaviensis]|uniref:Uncharacterized protein n=1 Tax=Neophaeococcomyces mojaviensis TaxID=3383035 RepID=A0ACC2ZTT3_9EURO|nr:hypothetical protein H2198_009648 [Knufia sp. JES_112]
MSDAINNVGWVDQPKTRGTFDVILSCLLTVFLCCWTVVHPAVARPGSSKWRRILDKTVCLLVAAIAPEVVVYLAVCELANAKYTNVQMSSEPRIGHVWTTTHSFTAHMGGFGLTTVMNDVRETKNGWINARIILSLIQSGRISPSRLPTRAEIEDKSKADVMVKALAFVQALWVLVQCIARAAQHLPITTIELSTVAYIPCAVVISCCWWNKPMDIEKPFLLELLASDVQQPPTNSSCNNDYAREGSTLFSSIATYDYHTYPLARASADAVSSVFAPAGRENFMTACFCLLFGGLHCLAWNLHFPTPIERFLWRVGSIIIACSIPLSWLLTRVITSVMARAFPEAWYGLVRSRNPSKTQIWGSSNLITISELF